MVSDRITCAICGKEFKALSTLHLKQHGYTFTRYMYDFVITSPIKACIEFNGDFWHANPTRYMPSDILNFPIKKKYASEIWEFDRAKLNLLERNGYATRVVWDSEFKKDPNKIVEECHEWLQNI